MIISCNGSVRWFALDGHFDDWLVIQEFILQTPPLGFRPIYAYITETPPRFLHPYYHYIHANPKLMP